MATLSIRQYEYRTPGHIALKYPTKFIASWIRQLFRTKIIRHIVVSCFLLIKMLHLPFGKKNLKLIPYNYVFIEPQWVCKIIRYDERRNKSPRRHFKREERKKKKILFYFNNHGDQRRGFE